MAVLLSIEEVVTACRDLRPGQAWSGSLSSSGGRIFPGEELEDEIKTRLGVASPTCAASRYLLGGMTL